VKLTPWHEVVQLRSDLKTGELSLSLFAADLYDVAMDKARPVYQDPYQFFSLTYPTFNLRELARDVVLRLAGKNDKAIRQLELTYGGGKTHTLITLYHLTKHPRALPADLPAVQEFTQHIGQMPPQARIAVLAFDKLDAEKGMQVHAPDGEIRWLKHPWSVLAFQLAGREGLRILNANNEELERESAPAEPLLVDLLSIPIGQGLAPLILIDEVLMYAREKVGLDPGWQSKLANFFQYLTQAATKVGTCAIVASLLATDPMKSDTLGKELTRELSAILRREKEESVQPVLKEDVAEVLRRRFFEPESIRDRNAFRKHVTSIVQGIAEIDEQTKRDMKGAERRFLESYPFHPDLTEVLYSKWTQLESFQRTRGILRTFALALRDAEKWDTSPLVATNVFLGEPGKAALSESAHELTNVAETEEYEGKRQSWTSILEGELAKAREIQAEVHALGYREVEQAVFATFLHSQPIGQKAQTREILTLLGSGKPDKIELEKALRQWTEVSWFLDEGAFQDAETGQIIYKGLPGYWRLGSHPNLKQMHHDACTRVLPGVIEDKLIDAIRKCSSLTAGASGSGVHVHLLPEKPSEVDDDGDFRYVILGPKGASRPGSPSSEVRRFLTEKSGPEAPRVYRNAVILAVPSVEGLEAVRNAIRDNQGWLQVESQLKGQDIDNNRKQLLELAKKDTQARAAELVKQAYTIVVTVSDKNDIQAFKVVLRDNTSLFNVIKADPQSRILEGVVTAEALLPGGPYNLWHEGENEYRVNDMEKAFAQFYRLPKMLNRKAIVETLLNGCRNGLFVLRSTRADHSFKTFWYDAPDIANVKELNLVVVLSEEAALTAIPPRLFSPGTLPELWHGSELALREVYRYFSGSIRIQGEYAGETKAVPTAERSVVNEAIQAAVKEKRLWFLVGRASLLAEDVPADLLTDEATLQSPPPPLAPKDVFPDNLPEAWKGRKETTARDIAEALSAKTGKALPWLIVRDALTAAFNARFVERAGGQWPCDYAGAGMVRVCQRSEQTPQQPKPPEEGPPPPGERQPGPIPTTPGVLVADATLSVGEIQDLNDQLAALIKDGLDFFGSEPRFLLRIEVTPKMQPTKEHIEKFNQLLEEVSAELKLQ
jgi:Protein of unknown function (DUF499)